jgi:hypothetical protein
LYSLASVEQYLGNFDDALVLCEKAISIDSRHFEAHFLRSNLKRQNADSNHIEELEKLANMTFESPVGQSMICFALAKELEDCAAYSKSFRWRKIAAETYRKSFDYDAGSEIAFLNKIQEVYSSEVLSKTSSCNNNEAIFVLGLPRTGSTLVERIITANDKVHSAGELPNFSNLLSTKIVHAGRPNEVGRIGLVEQSIHIDFDTLANQYIESTRPETQKRPRFVDKFPQNSLYVGLIHMALPNSKIVLVERHPLDACYAIYKQIFTDIYQYSYSLDELADYYIAHHALMEHWKNSIPEAIHVVSYDKLILDTEKEIKKLVGFCELNWSDNYLNFQKNTQASTTASAFQVRQKLYSSSVGLWKNYQDELSPLIKKLTSAGILA